MDIAESNERTPRKPLRLMPGVVIVLLQWIIRFVVPLVAPAAMPIGVIGGLVGGLAVVVWWAFFSRAPRVERWGAIVLMIVAVIATRPILHPSIQNGMMGMMFFVYVIPIVSLGLVAGAVVSQHLADRPRRVTMAAAIVLSCLSVALVRTGGITGSADSEFAWRWTPTPEQKLLAQAGDEPKELPPALAEAETGANWPGFRGPGRDSIIPGVRIETNWSKSPPIELWRRPIGPGWSSFAVRGDLVYTQEQRGEDEVVACYRLTTGEPVWRHRDAARFWESNGGAGPRGTPTLSNGRVYTFGATGILNVLDARTGYVVWSRNAAADTGAKLPGWGFASSPLVVGDVVVVATSGKLVGYEVATGNPRWYGPAGRGSYSSPHLVTMDGVTQIILLSGTGAVSVAPADGKVLWEHSWQGAAIVQPAVTADGDILLSTGGAAGGIGIRRLAVASGPGGWTVEERWTSNGLKPYFNDFVVHKGHAFGFDGFMLSSIDLTDGKRQWKGGRYGNGQLVLLRDQDVLLVLSEKGELALVAATPDDFTELARFPAIEGKTWNHPVLVGDVLLVRNDREMAAFRLALASR